MQQMRRMTNQMMSDPFGGFLGGFGMPGMMMGGLGTSLMPRLGGFSAMPMPTMNNRLLSAGGGGVSFSSSSSTFCMSTGANGQPQIYKETSSTRTGPNGLKETRRTVEGLFNSFHLLQPLLISLFSDSRTGTRKMAIGHHLGERSRVVEKEENVRTGQREEHEELINLDEDETDDFERDFQQKSQRTSTSSYPRRHQLQIEEVSSEPLPAILS